MMRNILGPPQMVVALAPLLPSMRRQRNFQLHLACNQDEVTYCLYFEVQQPTFNGV